MSDTEEEDIPEEFSVQREKEISENVEANFEVLDQKTVNFEDLLNELVSMGCLSFEDKYKIGLAAGDDPVICITLQSKILVQIVMFENSVAMNKFFGYNFHGSFLELAHVARF